MILARYITQHDLSVYQRAGWLCAFYGTRGDDLDCFIATFRCCQ